MTHQQLQQREREGLVGTPQVAYEDQGGSAVQRSSSQSSCRTSPRPFQRGLPVPCTQHCVLRAQGWASITGPLSAAAHTPYQDYCEATGRDTQSCRRGRCADQWKREGSLRWPRAHIFNRFLTEVPRQFNRERSIFSTSDARTIGCQYEERKKNQRISYIRISLKGLMEVKSLHCKTCRSGHRRTSLSSCVLKGVLAHIYRDHNETYEGGDLFSLI